MERNLDMTRGLIYSGQVLLALVESGMARGEAYDLVQSAARRVWAGEGDLLSSPGGRRARDAIASAPMSWTALFDPSYHLRGIEVPFARLGLG